MPDLADATRHFDTNCISPGTAFMNRMGAALHRWAAQMVAADTDGLWGRLAVIVSDGSVPGEGEHKAMRFIRAQRSHPSYDPNTRHCIEGLRAGWAARAHVGAQAQAGARVRDPRCTWVAFRCTVATTIDS